MRDMHILYYANRRLDLKSLYFAFGRESRNVEYNVPRTPTSVPRSQSSLNLGATGMTLLILKRNGLSEKGYPDD